MLPISPNQKSHISSQAADILDFPATITSPKRGYKPWIISPEQTEGAPYLPVDASVFSNFFPSSKYCNIPAKSVLPPEDPKETATQPVYSPTQKGDVMTPSLLKKSEEEISYPNTSQILPEEEICFLKDAPILVTENDFPLWSYVKYATVGILSSLGVYFLIKNKKKRKIIRGGYLCLKKRRSPHKSTRNR